LTRSSGTATIRTRSELQARGSAAGRLEFFPLSKTAQLGLPTSDHLHRGGPTTVNNKPTYLSKDGLEKLRSELDEMVSIKRPEVANRGRVHEELVARHGWAEMGHRIPIRCFQFNSSVKSSLTFLRKTPWARTRVETWFIEEGLNK
jgi:hypothetical protein